MAAGFGLRSTSLITDSLWWVYWKVHRVFGVEPTSRRPFYSPCTTIDICVELLFAYKPINELAGSQNQLQLATSERPRGLGATHLAKRFRQPGVELETEKLLR
jgi:hypothetical protein